MKTTLIAAAAIAATLSSCSGAKTSTLTGASFRHTASDKTHVAATDSSRTLVEITLEDPVLDWQPPQPRPDSSDFSHYSHNSNYPKIRLTASRLAVRLSSSDFRRLTLAHAAADTTAADTLASASSQSPPPAAAIAAQGISTVRLIFLVGVAGLLGFFFYRAARHHSSPKQPFVRTERKL